MAARRFIAPQARAGNGLGYLSQPQREFPVAPDPAEVVERVRACTSMCDEPEAPSQAWLNAEAELAAKRNRLAKAAEVEQARKLRPMLTLEQRMMDAKRRAKINYVDIRAEYAAIERMLDYARTENERRAERTVRAAVRRLERVEDRLDQPPGELAA